MQVLLVKLQELNLEHVPLAEVLEIRAALMHQSETTRRTKGWTVRKIQRYLGTWD